MKTTFAKTAIAAGVVAALGYGDASVAASLSPTAGDVVILGCSVPSAGTTVATVYSIDATSSQNSTYTLSLPTAVAVGQSCAGALAALSNVTSGSSYYFAQSTATGGTVAPVPVNQAIPGTGYSLQEFTLLATTSAPSGVAGQAAVGFIGCAAPTGSGATVYSVDTSNQTNSSSVVSLQGLVGKPCSYALAKAASGAGTGFGTTQVGQTILNINTSGYSLNQYTFQ